MTKINAISPRNTMAISAMLMLSAGSAFAQEATVPVTEAPVVSAPVTAPPVTAPAAITAPQAPTIVIPTPAPEAAAVAAAEPEVAASVVSTTSTAQPQPRTTQSPARTARSTSAAAPMAAVPAATAALAPSAAPAPSIATPASETAPTPSTAEPAAASNADDSSSDWALPVAGGASLIVLGGIALALSRRKRVYEEDADFVAPVAPRPTPRPQAEVRPSPTSAATPRATAAMRSGWVATGSEREALIERIVASPPDAANPFTSAKARRRRARIMVQSMQTPPTAAAAVSRDVRSEEAPARPDYAFV